jgi:hypothetical protein
MPANKDLETLTRARMKKTGESYTTARAQLLRKMSHPAPTVVPESRFAELAGMSDDAVKAKTGKTWKQWVRVLDAIDAPGMPHRDIAGYLSKGVGIPGWWAQGVTVGYERIRGLRDVRQRRGGRYDANKSKTFPVPLSTLYRAFSRKRKRERWLPGVAWNVSKATTDKSIRLKWDDGNSLVLYFTAKTPDKSHVSVQHAGLVGKQDVERVKAFWAERLAELSEIL